MHAGECRRISAGRIPGNYGGKEGRKCFCKSNMNLDLVQEQILQVCPDIVDMETDDRNSHIRFCVPCGMRGVNIHITIGTNHMILQAGQEYPFRLIEKNCLSFSETVNKQYPVYQIYVSEDKLSITYRMTFDKVDHLADITEKFLSAVAKIAPEFEVSCVDFSSKRSLDVADEEDSRLEDAQDEIEGEGMEPVAIDGADAPAENKQLQSEILEEFESTQKEYCAKAFYGLAGELKCPVMETDGSPSFIYPTKHGRVTVCLNMDDELVEMGYCISITNPTSAYMTIADINAAYEDMFAKYENEVLKISRYVVPDPYNQDGLKAAFQEISAAYREETGDGQENELELAKNMSLVIEQQSKILLDREDTLAKREEECRKAEKELAEKEAELERQKENVQTKYTAMKKEFDSKMAILAKREEELEKELESAEHAKGKYLINMQKLTDRLAFLQARGSTELKGSAEDEEKYKAKISSLMKNRAYLEKEMDRRSVQWKEKEAAYQERIKQQDEDLRQLEEKIKRENEAAFTAEKVEYEKKLKELEAAAEITRQEATPDGFYNYLLKTGAYGEVKRLHGDAQEIIAYDLDKGITVKVVFGKTLFADVAKKIKSRNIKTLNILNSQISDVKFFVREGTGEIIARKYYSQYEDYQVLASGIIGLTEHFA